MRSSLWFYCKNEVTDFNNNFWNSDQFKSFKCKATLLGNTVAQPTLNQTNETVKSLRISVPLKYPSNF